MSVAQPASGKPPRTWSPAASPSCCSNYPDPPKSLARQLLAQVASLGESILKALGQGGRELRSNPPWNPPQQTLDSGFSCKGDLTSLGAHHHDALSRHHDSSTSDRPRSCRLPSGQRASRPPSPAYKTARRPQGLGQLAHHPCGLARVRHQAADPHDAREFMIPTKGSFSRVMSSRFRRNRTTTFPAHR